MKIKILDYVPFVITDYIRNKYPDADHFFLESKHSNISFEWWAEKNKTKILVQKFKYGQIINL